MSVALLFKPFFQRRMLAYKLRVTVILATVANVVGFSHFAGPAEHSRHLTFLGKNAATKNPLSTANNIQIFLK